MICGIAYFVYRSHGKRKQIAKPYSDFAPSSSPTTSIGKGRETKQFYNKREERHDSARATPQSEIVILQKGTVSVGTSESLRPSQSTNSLYNTHNPSPNLAYGSHRQPNKVATSSASTMHSFAESYRDRPSADSFHEKFSIAESYQEKYSIAESYQDKLSIAGSDISSEDNVNKLPKKKSQWAEAMTTGPRDTSDSYAMLGSSFGSVRDSRFSRISRYSSDSRV